MLPPYRVLFFTKNKRIAKEFARKLSSAQRGLIKT